MQAVAVWWSKSPSRHFALFHSTAVSLAKWKSKSSFKDDGSAPQPSKTQIRYAVRQKRADTKRALKDFLLYGKSSKLHCQDEDLGWRTDKSNSRNSGKSKSHHGSTGKGKHGGSKRWKNKYTFCDDDDYEPRETIFQSAFGGQRGFTWYSSWENSHYENSTSGFEWKDQSRWDKTQRKVWSESDIEDDSTDVVSNTHRHTLGLPSTGPLKLDDVKCAFRASALKWHPDKHQGPSQNPDPAKSVTSSASIVTIHCTKASGACVQSPFCLPELSVLLYPRARSSISTVKARFKTPWDHSRNFAREHKAQEKS